MELVLMNTTLPFKPSVSLGQMAVNSTPAWNLYESKHPSINETLSRTVITSGTVMIVLIVLIIFGGEVNRGFAFTFLIGTITGTYSSIYVASSIVLDYTRYKNIKAHQVS